MNSNSILQVRLGDGRWYGIPAIVGPAGETIGRIYNVTAFGAVADDQHDLATAINDVLTKHADEPGIIYIPAGEWWMAKNNVCVHIGTGWSLVGAGMEQTIIKSKQANDDGAVFLTIDAENVVYRDFSLWMKESPVKIMDGIGIMRSSNVICERLKLETEWKAITSQGGGAENVVIRDCVFVDNLHSGVAWENEASTPTNGLLIQNCRFIISAGCESDYGHIFLYSSSYEALTNIEIDSCVFAGAGNAVYGTYCNHVTVRNAVIDGGVPFSYRYAKNILYENCKGSGLTAAVLVTQVDNVRFSDCEFAFESNAVSMGDESVKNVQFINTVITGAGFYLRKSFDVDNSNLRIESSVVTLTNGVMQIAPTYAAGAAPGTNGSGTVTALAAVKERSNWRLRGWVYITADIAPNATICTIPLLTDAKTRMIGWHTSASMAPDTPVLLKIENGALSAGTALTSGFLYVNADLFIGE